MLGINKVSITPQMLRLVGEVDEFKGLWTGLERHTSALHLLGDVADYGANFKQLLSPLQEKPITPDLIRALHAVLLKQKGVSVYKLAADKLSFLDKEGMPVGYIATAEPDQVEAILGKLCEWANEAIDETHPMHPLLVMAVFTAVFLQLSPFENHNMQLMRFLLLLLMMKAGYVYAPYASYDGLMELRAENIYQAILHNQKSLEAGAPDWSVWLPCFFDLLAAQKDVLIARLYEKQLSLGEMPKLSLKIMELFRAHKRLQMKEIIKLTNGRRATIKLRLQELLDDGYLVRHGAGRSTWYSLD
ncbi:MAG: Fic family protein [Micavibrio sp.]|nr:Fic family protein [Micavibrio sp.]